jgi:hypothetical protein
MESPSDHLIVHSKRFYLEPWLVLDSSTLWQLVLPFAGPV